MLEMAKPRVIEVFMPLDIAEFPEFGNSGVWLMAKNKKKSVRTVG